MGDRSKWAFWAFVLAALALISVPSTILLETFRGYARFLRGFEPRPLRLIKTARVPHQRGTADASRTSRGAELEFVEFRLHAPKAGKVELIGDFNGWREGTLKLTSQPRGQWELVLPLPKGSHHYLFVIDGQATLDPKNPRSEAARGRPASVMVVR